jgi:hypothetical protein
MSPVPDSAELAALIRGLGEQDARVRERAGAELFRRGCELGRAAAARWFTDPEFAKNFVLDASHFPATTVGVAVTPPSFDRIRAANDSPRLAEVPPDQDAKEFELHLAEGIQLDVLTTREPAGTGAIARYLQKFGEGIQQIEFLTRSVDAATQILRLRFGVQPIYPGTRPGADGSRVNFYLASAADGTKVLIELVEAPAATTH